MSQRSEHLRRQMDKLAGRIAALESDRRFDDALHTAREETAWRAARRNAAAYRQAVEARRRASRLLLNVCLLLILLMLLSCVLLAVDVQADLPPDRPAPVVQAIPAIPGPTEEPENERIEAALLSRAQVIEDCTVTWYTADTCGKQPGDPGYGITASGLPVTEHLTCATDPKVIPMYSDVFVEYADGTIEQLWATDTGVQGNAVDIYTPDYDYAIQCGRQNLTVWYVAPEG